MMDEQTLFDVLTDAPEHENFSVTDYQSATWAVGKAVEAGKALAVLDARYREFQAKLAAWYAAEKKKLEGTMSLMEGYLRPWATSELEGKKRRSLDFPGARIQFRESGGRTVVADDQMLVTYAREHHPEAIRVVESVAKADARKWVEGGEPVPGVFVEHDPPSMTVEAR